MLNGRFEVWQAVWAHFHAQPASRQLFGMGWNSFGVVSDGQLFLTAHNDWLQILYTSGWAGLTLFALFYAHLFRLADHRNRAVLAGFGVAMCGNPVLHFLPTLLVFATVVGETSLAQIREIRKARTFRKNNDLYRNEFGTPL